MSKPVVILDACVLYPAPLRDVLISLAAAREAIYRARWTETIFEEWTRNVLHDRQDITRAQLDRTLALMNLAVPDALVTDYQNKIEQLSLPDKDDRHVLAAAIVAEANLIVTFNCKHFPHNALAPYNVECINPDIFLSQLIDGNPNKFVDALQKMRSRLTRPTKSAAEFLDTLSQQRLPLTIERLKEFQKVL